MGKGFPLGRSYGPPESRVMALLPCNRVLRAHHSFLVLKKAPPVEERDREKDPHCEPCSGSNRKFFPDSVSRPSSNFESGPKFTLGTGIATGPIPLTMQILDSHSKNFTNASPVEVAS